MADFLTDVKEMSEILGQDNIDCLTNLFEEMDGQPPCVDKKRYRANHPDQISILNYLEESPRFITVTTNKTQQFYHLRSYALPLIKTPKAQNLLNLMCEIYKKFPALYKKYLDAPVTREELMKTVDAPKDKILEGLHYFHESHDVWDGWGKDFPYETGSQINLSEKVILRGSFLDILSDYYHWNFLEQKEAVSQIDSAALNNLSEIDVKDNKVGRPSLKNKIIEAYEYLKNKNKIDYSKTLKSHTELIQETVHALNPEIISIRGMQHEAIRRAVSGRFHSEKENL